MYHKYMQSCPPHVPNLIIRGQGRVKDLYGSKVAQRECRRAVFFFFPAGIVPEILEMRDVRGFPLYTCLRIDPVIHDRCSKLLISLRLGIGYYKVIRLGMVEVDSLSPTHLPRQGLLF